MKSFNQKLMEVQVKDFKQIFTRSIYVIKSLQQYVIYLNNYQLGYLNATILNLYIQWRIFLKKKGMKKILNQNIRMNDIYWIFLNIHQEIIVIFQHSYSDQRSYFLDGY
ncbi:unnamed protein product [Paramecium pentaurelia]|uniref:Uncharacterized protein n=1 Tax=Paramecium pentaurelia TaxID=43138 RepID=A0A8S1X0S1_9CILI|nr:unnamed protein product [Paramecium pentaurelia]